VSEGYQKYPNSGVFFGRKPHTELLESLLSSGRRLRVLCQEEILGLPNEAQRTEADL